MAVTQTRISAVLLWEHSSPPSLQAPGASAGLGKAGAEDTKSTTCTGARSRACSTLMVVSAHPIPTAFREGLWAPHSHRLPWGFSWHLFMLKVYEPCVISLSIYKQKKHFNNAQKIKQSSGFVLESSLALPLLRLHLVQKKVK